MARYNAVRLGILLALLAGALLWLAPWLVPVPAGALKAGRCLSYVILDRYGVTLRKVRSENWRTSCPVPLGEISPHLVNATIAAEDRNFFRHGGVDFGAVARAFYQNVRSGRVVSGASTITQQLIANTYVHRERTLPVKITEALMALRLERAASKERIIESYLNIVPYGNGTFGVEAASHMYFERPASHLSLAQAAFLAAIPQSPTLYDPFTYFARTKQRQEWILGRMEEIGMISKDLGIEARGEPIDLSRTKSKFLSPHFCDLIVSSGALSMQSGSGVGTSSVTTTLDCGIQQEVEGILRTQVRLLQKKSVTNGAVVVVHNATGDVIAMAGSADYFDRSHQGQVNGAVSLRQPGSALKPFTYGLALERGWSASTIIADLPVTFRTAGGAFEPHNYDGRFHGPVRLRTALACSYNVPAVRTLDRLGTELLLERLRLAGFRGLIRDASHYGLALTLGCGEVTLLELARAYRSLAMGGERSELRFFLKPAGTSGETPARVFSPQVAYLLTSILSDRSARTPAFGSRSPLNLPFPCAVKTGTSRDFRDNWTVGYTTDYTVGVWVGNFSGDPMHDVGGVSGAAPIFRDVMLALHRRKHPGPFERPEGLVERVICPVSGELKGSSCPGAMDEIYIPGTAPLKPCTVHRLVATDMRIGLPAVRGTGPEYVREKVVEVWPAEYRAWLKKQHRYFAPEIYRENSINLSRGPVIISPGDDEVYVIDPDVRREFQDLALRARIPVGASSASWTVDGVPLAEVPAPFSCRWHLRPGRHVFVVSAAGKASRPVTITVR